MEATPETFISMPATVRKLVVCFATTRLKGTRALKSIGPGSLGGTVTLLTKFSSCVGKEKVSRRPYG